MNLIDNYGSTEIIDEEQIIKLGKKVEDDYYHVLLLPQSSSRKERIEAIGRLFGEVVTNVSLNLEEYNGTVTENNIHINQAYALREMSRFIGYFFNCSQWRDAESYLYDSDELKKRFEKIKNFL